MKYAIRQYHLVSKEEADFTKGLKDHIFKKLYAPPSMCAYSEAMDRLFGCPFLFKNEKERKNIALRCNSCPCNKKYFKAK